MKLLVIEDDRQVVLSLRRALRTLYITDVAHSGATGLHLAEVGEYSVIVLDLGLPDLPGIEVCQRLKQLAPLVPILVLTGEVEIANKVELLDAGADDYLTKPFSVEELKARLRVLSRRRLPHASSSLLRAGSLTLNLATREVHRGDTPIALRRKEFDVLEFLVRNQGSVVTRASIMENVWENGEQAWTNAIDVHIKNLRDRIDRPFGLSSITTVHGVGYRLDLEHVPKKSLRAS